MWHYYWHYYHALSTQTHTIVEMLLHCLATSADSKLLVVAETHAAVDNVLRKLKARLDANPLLSFVQLLRLGDVANVAKDLQR